MQKGGWIAIEFARKELIGIKYLEVARRIYATVLASRAFDPPGSSASDSLPDIFRDLATNESNAAPTLQTEAHGGRLWASRGARRGSVFHLVLPSSE